jgi:hypothetical protein
VVKKGYCCISDAVTGQSFSAQAAIWEAGSAYQWEKAYRERDHYEVSKMYFGELLERVKRDEVDETDC